MPSLLIHNIGMLATACGCAAKGGEQQGDILTLQNAYIAVDGERISAVGQGEVPTQLLSDSEQVIDAQQRTAFLRMRRQSKQRQDEQKNADA